MLFAQAQRLTALAAEERPRLFYWSPVAMGCGIGAYFVWPYEPSLKLSLGLLAAACLVVLALRQWIVVRAVFLAVFGFAAATYSTQALHTTMLDWPTRATQIRGDIVDIEQHKSGRRLLLERVEIESLPPHRTPERIRMVMPRRLDKQAPDLAPGQHIEAVAKVMPLSEPMLPDGFDFRRNAYFRGIGATGYLMGKIQLSEGAGDDPIFADTWFATLRQKLQAAIRQSLDGDKAGLAIILMTGDQTSLSPETADAMRSIGLAHLLAIAGLHIGLVAGIVFYLTRAMLALFPYLALRFPIKKWAAGAALLAIVFFTLQVGAPVPTRRSVVMMGILLLGVMLDRVSLSFRTVTLAAIVILTIWPQMLLHPAFQLSFAAVLGIIAISPYARGAGRNLSYGNKGMFYGAFRHVVELAVTSVAATLATLPFCLYHFQEAEVYSVLSNTLAIPLTSFWLMPLCIMTELLWLVDLHALPLKLLEPGLGLLIGLSHGIAQWPGAHASPPQMSLPLLVVATFGGLWFCLSRGRKRLIGLAVTLVAIVITFFGPRPVMLISPDGQQAGWWIHSSAQLATDSHKDDADKFLAAHWGERYGYKGDDIQFVGDIAALPPLDCTPERCVREENGVTFSWLRKPEALAAECAAGRAVVVNTLDDTACEGGAALMLTRTSFRMRGAHALFVEDGKVTIRHAREGRALRPWSVGWRWGGF